MSSPCVVLGGGSNTASISRARPLRLRARPLRLRARLGTLGRVSLSQLRYFVAVAEEASVGRAALRVRVAQPALSRQIHALEGELGGRLFSRTSRGMTLLPRGRVLLAHARAILSAVDLAIAAARRDPDAPTCEGVGDVVRAAPPGE
ncbi:MAG: LysR family transcriptional regulator [Polyangiaceae bacterium]|nr:LysR family transcriptional regulator [Polyangiaceae bacterium]